MGDKRAAESHLARAQRFARAPRSLPLAAQFAPALAGVALAPRQFALLNRVRNTDNFFMGVKKKSRKKKIIITAIFKGKVAIRYTTWLASFVF